MTLDDLVSPYRDDDDDRRKTYRRRSSMVRNSLPLSRFWSPSDALARQPWYGFPGGREAWLEWKQTGQMPLQAGESRSRHLTPEQRDFYYRLPEGSPDPQPAAPSVVGGSPIPGYEGTVTPVGHSRGRYIPNSGLTASGPRRR